MNNNPKVTISISEVQALLKEGVTRTAKTKGYSPEKGSIGEKYGLNDTQVNLLFKHPKLAGLRTVFPAEAAFDIIDDTETSNYGVPSVAAAERLEENMVDDAEIPSSLSVDESDYQELESTTVTDTQVQELQSLASELPQIEASIENDFSF